MVVVVQNSSMLRPLCLWVLPPLMQRVQRTRQVVQYSRREGEQKRHYKVLCAGPLHAHLLEPPVVVVEGRGVLHSEEQHLLQVLLLKQLKLLQVDGRGGRMKY